MTPKEAVAMARRLFPSAFRVYVYDAAHSESHSVSGAAVVNHLPARVKIQTCPVPLGGMILNQPCGEGPNLTAALRALCRCPIAEAPPEVRSEVLSELGGDDPTDGGCVTYWMDGTPPVPEDE